MPSRSSRLSVIALLVAPSLAGAEAPIPVSPGSGSELARVESRCPTFSWGEIPGARGYELAIYRIDGGELREALRQTVPAAALSWTPSLDRCLGPGASYAWLVRGAGEEGAGDWSRPSLFQIGAGPPPEGLATAVATLRRNLPDHPKPSSSPPPTTAEPALRSQEVPSPEAAIRPGTHGGASGVELRNDSVLIAGLQALTTATDQDTLGALSCASGQVAVWSGSAWACSAPPCPTGQTDCSGVCVDTQTDESYCGSCSTACDPGERCTSGTCQTSCQTGLFNCSGTCRDLQTDVYHCGTCFTPCPNGQRCISGNCQLDCQAGLTNCSGSCVDTQTDEANCGSCGTTCTSGFRCESSSCQLSCEPTWTECDGDCVNTFADNFNCGGCGITCDPGEVCNFGMCQSPP